MNLKKKKASEVQKYADFLEQHKYIVGLSDWTILFSLEVSTSDAICEVEAETGENTLKVCPSEQFYKRDEKERLKVLLHELIHGRVLIFNKRADEHIDLLEEQLVNDLVFGIEKLVSKKIDIFI